MCRWTKITSGNPQGNGVAENMVKQVKVALENLASKFPRRWPRFLPFIQLCFADMMDERLGTTPAMAHMGRMPGSLVEMEMPSAQEVDREGTQVESVKEAARRWAAEAMELVQHCCRTIMEEKKRGWAAIEDKEAFIEKNPLEAGEIVWLYDAKIKSRLQEEKAIHKPWTGPWLVKRVLASGLAVLRISDNKQKKVSLRLCKRYHVPLVGMDMADSAAYAKARPVRIRSHKKEGDQLKYLVAMLTQENEICEWVNWWMLPPSMIQDYRTEVEHNPSLVLYSVGTEVSVWWPAMRRTFKGVVESLTGNLMRVMYDDGDKGEAYVAVDGQVVQAEEYDEEQLRREREEARLAEEERQMRADSSAGTVNRRGRVPGSKNKVQGTRKRGYQ